MSPPVWRRAWFYLGGVLPPQYAAWAEAKLASRWGFLIQHIAGSIALFVCAVVPFALLLGLAGDEVLRVSLITLAGIVVGSLLFAERFRRSSVERHARKLHRTTG